MINLTDNLILNIRKVGMGNPIYVIYLDQFTYNHYKDKDIKLIKADDNSFKNVRSNYCDYGTRLFRNITMKKFPGIKQVLKLHKEVIYMDSDIGVFKNFNTYFKNAKADILCSVEYNGTYCAGFMYFKKNKRTLDFIDKHIQISNKRINKREYFDDQSIFNNISKWCDPVIIYLPEHKFCNGHYIEDRNSHFYPGCYPVPKSAYIAHANCIRGLDKKIKLLKKLGLYLISSQPQTDNDK